MKIKPILPSMREKKRYIVFEIISKTKIVDINKIWETFKKQILSYLGVLGASKAGVIFIEDKYNPQNQRGIIRVNNKYVDQLKSSLIFTETIGDIPVIIQTVGISGILKKAENKFI